MRCEEIASKFAINREKKRTKHDLNPGEHEQKGWREKEGSAKWGQYENELIWNEPSREVSQPSRGCVLHAYYYKTCA